MILYDSVDCFFGGLHTDLVTVGVVDMEDLGWVPRMMLDTLFIGTVCMYIHSSGNCSGGDDKPPT